MNILDMIYKFIRRAKPNLDLSSGNGGAETTNSLKLIHPIYLDVPMLVSFAAAVEGGVVFGTEITREHSCASGTKAQASGSFGFSELFNRIFEASIGADKVRESSSEERARETESRKHTESSIAILLYDRLIRESGSILHPQAHKELNDLEPGALIELTGTIEKNAVDTMIDTIDAIDILSTLAVIPEGAMQVKQAGVKQKPVQDHKMLSSALRTIREALDKDRKRTPISNALLRCSQPKGCTAVVTLRTANLKDLTLSELHKNSARLVGKVTRIIREGESMSAFENYGLALLNPKMLNELFQETLKSHDIRAEFSKVEIEGPAVQVLPLMIFV